MRKKSKSNLNIRSNLYLIPNDFALHVRLYSFNIPKTEASFPMNVRYIRQIRDHKLFNKLPANIQKYGNEFQKDQFGRCSADPAKKEVTFGPIRKRDQIIYGCRCPIKATCRYKRITKQDCKTCPRNVDY